MELNIIDVDLIKSNEKPEKLMNIMCVEHMQKI